MGWGIAAKGGGTPKRADGTHYHQSGPHTRFSIFQNVDGVHKKARTDPLAPVLLLNRDDPK